MRRRRRARSRLLTVSDFQERGPAGSAGPLFDSVMSGISSSRWNCPPGFDMMLYPLDGYAAHGSGGKAGKDGRERVRFDPDRFLMNYADAFNGRDPEKLQSFFALDDPRFAVFEDISEDLFNGTSYGVLLERAFDATGEMSFELLRCDRFGDFAIIHAIQKIVDEDNEDEGVIVEAQVRATMWVVLSGEEARVVAAHFSSFPSSTDVACPQGTCTG